MALPTFQAAGTVVESATIAVTPVWPTHVSGDVALLIVESGGQNVELTTHAGFKEVSASPRKTNVRTSAAHGYMAVYWCRATSAAMDNPTVKFDAGHLKAVILTFRGCGATGNPWNVSAGAVDDADDSDVSFPAVTTTDANCLIVNIYSNGGDIASHSIGSWTNAALANIVERLDAFTTIGGGSHIAVATGEKAVAGAVGSTTAVLTGGSARDVKIVLALTGVANTPETSPYIAGTGSAVSANAADLSVPWPVHEVGDIGILMVEYSVYPHSLATPSGFLAIPNTQNGNGTSGTGAATGISLWWKRAVGGDANPVVDWTSTVVRAIIFVIRNVKPTGDPFDGSQSNNAASTTTLSIPSGITAALNGLVILTSASEISTASDNQVTTLTNADLAPIRIVHQSHGDAGPGQSGMLIAEARKPGAGTYTNTTGTRLTATAQASASFAVLARDVLTTDAANAGTVAVTGEGIGSVVTSPMDTGVVAPTGDSTEELALGRVVTDAADTGAVLTTGQDADDMIGSFTESGFWLREDLTGGQVWIRELPTP